MFSIQKTTNADKSKLLKLYQVVASQTKGLARELNEITDEFIDQISTANQDNGLSFSAFDDGENLIGEIHAFRSELRVFSHLLTNLTIAVHPNFHGKGIGKSLFEHFLIEIETNHHHILRVELITRESNLPAISLYKQLGFKVEGRLEQRIKLSDGNMEADLPMVWMNKNYNR